MTYFLSQFLILTAIILVGSFLLAGAVLFVKDILWGDEEQESEESL